MSYILAPATSRNNIIRLTSDIRTMFGLNEQDAFPVVEFVEHCIPLVDNEFNCSIVYPEDLPSSYAEYNPINNTMQIREDVYCKAIRGSGRDRFTIAHEIGHYFLHSDTVSLSRVSLQQRVPAYRDPEWQANTFASELMMPYQIIKNLTPEQIAFRCQTSMQAAKIAHETSKKAKHLA